MQRDLRAKLTLKSVGGKYTLPLNGPGEILRRTNGIMFPFTPDISVAHSTDYSTYDLTHTNYQQNAYARTRNPSIQITGTFVSQTIEEAKYTVGVMHFLRVASKMNWGASDEDAGTPPPVLSFSAYGTYNFTKVPVVIAGFNLIYTTDIDYVKVDINGEMTQVPIMSTISIDLMPHYSPALQNKFTLKNFASGAGYKTGFI